MKNSKGLLRDTLPKDQPEETYPFAKNGIKDNVRGSDENEPGFRLSAIKVPYGIPNGVVETSKFPVIFCTNNINSAVGYYDPTTDTYIPILDDANLPFLLGFNSNNYITGQAQNNYLDHVVIAFTDKRVVPMYLDCDVPNIKALEDLLLFPVAQAPDISLVAEAGGALLPGAYFAAVRYLKNDGTMTSFLVISDVIFISGNPGVVQNMGLTVTLTNIDPNFDLAEIAIISKVAGVFDQQLLQDVQLAPVTVVSYTGTEATTTITLEEVLQNPVVYNKVGCMGQLNDYLYIGNLEAPQEVAMQQYALLVKFKWASQLDSTFPVDPLVKSGQKRGFMHREVYATYIQYSLASGGWSRAFHCPGDPLTPGDLAPSALGAIGSVAAATFQADDTIPNFDFASGTGSMGKWQNATELYPTTDDFNATAIGGADLRGLPVRHHRFPSIRWCKNNLYQFNPDYGRTQLDILGLQVSNVIIPSGYEKQITGYRILYAERNSGNSTVIAQSLYLLGGRAVTGANYDPSVQAMGGPFTNFLSAGGNWFTEDHTTGGLAGIRQLYPDPRIVRFHAFDLLFNQPSIQPSYLCNELKLKMPMTAMLGPGYVNNGSLSASDDSGLCFLLDYLTNGVTPTAATDQVCIRKVLTSQYVPSNLVSGNWNNSMNETCFGMTVGGPECLHLGTTPNPADDPTSDFSYLKLILHGDNEPFTNIPQFENSFLTSLMFLRSDLYLTFAGQDLVVANSRVNGNAPTTIFSGGDVFINDYTFNNYGWIDAVNDGFTGYNDPINGGVRVARRFSCEAAANIAARFEQLGNQYSNYYPASPLVRNSADNYLVKFNRTNDPNQFGYTKDANTLNTLVSAQIFSPLISNVYQFPFRIHRGGKLDQLDKRRNWRTWNPLDFYEMQKNFGPIQFLDGIDDRLLILCTKALFLTQDKTQFNGDVIPVTLGSGDIFQFEPQPALYAKLGYGGNQHDLACLVTPMGFVFVDAAQGQIFLWKGGLKLLNEGVNAFLRDALRSVVGNNAFTGNGIILGYDPYYRRLFLTVKNQVLLANQPAPLVWQATQAFIETLTPNRSLVLKDGRVQLYLGVNSTPYSCEVDPIPVVPNYVISVADNTAIGMQVLQTAGINVGDFYILSGNTSTAWALDAPSGRLTVAGPLSFVTQPQYVLQCSATNAEGFSTTFTITINLTATTRPPVTGDQTLYLPEASLAGTFVTQVKATDPNNLPLTYTITAGNTGGAFTIDGAGNITVATPSALSFLANPVFQLTVAVSNGTFTVNAIITINLTFVNQPPSTNDVVIDIYDTTPSNTQIGDLAALVFDEGVVLGIDSLVFSVVSDPYGTLFTIDPLGPVTLVNGAALNASTTPQYILQLQATDNGNPKLASFFRLIINVLFDPSTLSFAPAGSACAGGSCPPTYVLSPDGTLCVKTTSVNATPPSGPQIQAVAATDGSYSDFGAFVYQPGYASDGTGTIQQQLNSFPWNNPTDNLFDGALNRCGVWGSAPIPINTPMGFSVPFMVPAAGTYYIAIAGDNAGEVTVDGVVIITQDPTTMAASIATQFPIYAGQGISVAFKFWHIYPVALTAGSHYIGVQGINFGGVGAFGAEIYSNTLAQLIAAQLDPAFVANPGSFPPQGNHYSNLNLIFSTRWTRNNFFTSGVNNAYTCPATYALDPTQVPPQCVLLQTVPSTADDQTWSQVTVFSSKTGGVVATLVNMIGQTFQGLAVPYYAPVADSVNCGGIVPVFLSVQKQQAAIRNNCTIPIGSTVIYYVPAGRYMSTVSQADADGQAQTDATTNAQAYANVNGTCPSG